MTSRFPDGRTRIWTGLLASLTSSFFVIGLLVALPPTLAQSEGKFAIKPVAEKRLSQLPQAPLYWRIETFPTLTAAEAAVGPTSLAAEVAGRFWLFTLGAPGGSTSGGAKTPIHTHSGSETFYVLGGELSQRTPRGTMRLEAGQSMPGHVPRWRSPAAARAT